ncbi:hypothetical protein ABBQ32_012419 [Trebouxia sp. C0010 RCD-2024]
MVDLVLQNLALLAAAAPAGQNFWFYKACNWLLEGNFKSPTWGSIKRWFVQTEGQRLRNKKGPHRICRKVTQRMNVGAFNAGLW